MNIADKTRQMYVKVIHRDLLDEHEQSWSGKSYENENTWV